MSEVDPEKRPRIWIVDDSPLDADRARRALAESYSVEVFPDGSAMLEQLASRPSPDVVVLDWVMPGITGIEVCRFLRGGDMSRPQLAILLLTMQAQTQQIVEGLAAGANDYLVKPYADLELRARVDALVRSKQLLARAQQAEASVLQLLQNAPDALIGLDRAYRVTFTNFRAQRIFNREPTALLDRSIVELLPQLTPDHLRLAGSTDRALTDVQIGEEIFSPTVQFLPSQTDGGLTIALRNVTARRRDEARRLDFYSIIAHDLRSPLNAMLLRTEMLLRGHRGVLAAEVISDLRKMDSHMRRLVALINDFLDFARMEEAAHKMERVRVDLGELIGQIVDDFKPLVENTGQEIRVVVEPCVLVTLGDRSRLQQVLANLIANAIKFAPPHGTIRVAAGVVQTWCEVSVEDDGPGIAAEVVPQLFQRYARGPATGSESGGTGLGLLIVREIVEAHGGTVGVESTPGQGSRFWFRLPSADNAAMPALAAAP
ncbi:MAG TPA: ATP-binding protein [Polyangia bacterium]|nr:ATP-binding protein [Polyangia bacterium]